MSRKVVVEKQRRPITETWYVKDLEGHRLCGEGFDSEEQAALDAASRGWVVVRVIRGHE